MGQILQIFDLDEKQSKAVQEAIADMKDSLIGNLGIQFTYLSPNRVEATMPVCEKTRQPRGILHGGASLALAETLAGVGSMLSISSEQYSVGMEVTGHHVSSAIEGETVRAVATILHRGRTTHLWNVDIVNAKTGKLVSTERVVNAIRKKK